MTENVASLLQTKKKVLLIGHSFARRAGKLCPFKIGNVVINASGVSGGGVKNLVHTWDEVGEEMKPDIVYIQSGENDIGSLPWKDIADTLFRFAEAISSEKIKVVIGSKFKRYKFRNPRMTLAKYNTYRKQINKYIKKKCRETNGTAKRIRFCRMFKPYQTKDRFLEDGVHLTPATELLWVKMIGTYCDKKVDMKLNVRS
ncbi:uncharacterized protein LOC117319437 isoform X2 [Pecten maximus]|uniref:uncharacterized protein LOC117319437 isoform X2 n=1 Tax=Pecten maximus TaxID=6579 RepID=UPI001458B689|nr:uncharacterized protein LOC117319437 isoform X2 [Pecten maximus]